MHSIGYPYASMLVSGYIYLLAPLRFVSLIALSEGEGGQSEPPSTVAIPMEPITTTALESHTFLRPGKSYLEYRPQWTSLEKWGLEFDFRTHRGTTLLVHNSFQSKGLSINLWVRLKKGVLHVALILNADSFNLRLGKGLAHDHWHGIWVGVDLLRGELCASIDNEAHHNTTIEPETLHNVRQVLVGNVITGITSFGGFVPSRLQLPSRFIGCIRGVRFLEADHELVVPVHAKDAVKDGCLNACTEHNVCLHLGLCINYYLHTACDCFGTGYEGRHCDTPGETVVTLQGSEWVSYVISDVTDSTHSPMNKVGMEFKTRATEGVLFYGYSQSQYNHLALSLHNSSLHVSVVFMDQDNYDELWVALGAHLNDNKWHRVVVSHHGHEVEVQLDAQTQRMTGANNQRHLRMDPAVFIGGLENAHKALGLRSQQKFVGCLRAVYFNHDSVLEKLRIHKAVYHGALIQYGCQDMEHTALQFPHQGAFIKAEHVASEQLMVQLEFRTLKPDSILLYTEIRSGADKGYIQVLLERGQIELVVVPSTPHNKARETASVGENLHDNQWHSLHLHYNRGTGRLKVDGEVSVISVKWEIQISKATYFGFGPDTQMKYGYVGCMRNMHLQDADVDPVDMIHTQLGVGVTLGPCDLRDWCTLNGSSCVNAGQCVSMWSNTYCECQQTYYEGRFCQFSRLRRSCAEYFHAGERRSGVWPLDLDGSGPLPPIHVYCEMSALWGGRREGVTRVTHNLAEGTMVRDSSLVDHKKVVTYRELTRPMLQDLVAGSVSCHQWVHVNCSHSPLRLGEWTWLVTGAGLQYSSFGGDTAGACGCGESHTCDDPHLTCNCDADTAAPRWDGGYIQDGYHLPVTELIFRQGHDGQANVTLGPLRCGGTPLQSPDCVVTFTRADSFLSVSGWQHGPLGLSFRTIQTDAVLLYQPSTETFWTTAQFYMMLKEGHYIEVQTQQPKLRKTVNVYKPLNDGKWHHVSMETLMRQVRIQVDGESYLYDVGTERGPDNTAGLLYVAGYPNLTGAPAGGLTGCVRGLTLNGKTQTLQDVITDKNSGGVLPGCDPKCTSNPCVNGATCQENWTTYTCHCANQFAHSGSNCEININIDAVTFLEPSAFLEFHEPSHIDDAIDHVVFSFRTFQEYGLLLYVYDSVNNFVLVDITGPTTLRLSYNCGRSIVRHHVTVRDLTNGHWNQVAIQLNTWNAKVFVNNYEFLLAHPSPWKPLKEYLQNPFEDKEAVVPLRQTTAEDDMFHVYVGGVHSTMSALDGSTGCTRGLKIGKHVIRLSPSANQRSGVQQVCPSGCASSPCQHGGKCTEDPSYSGQFTCDCVETKYAAALCDRETGLYFDGSSLLTQKITPSLKTDVGVRESLHFNFATHTNSDRSRGLVLVTAENSLSDYMLVYLTPMGILGTELVVDYYKVILETSVSFSNGWPHHVSVHLEDMQITLKVDNLVEMALRNGSALFGPAAVISVGGILDQFRFAHLTNFTGEISNVYYLSDRLLPVRPIDAYLGEVNTTDKVVVIGSLRPATQRLAGSTSSEERRHGVVLSKLPGTLSPEVWTFPPWNVGPARTVNLAQVSTFKLSCARDFVGVAVCLAVLLAFILAIALLVVRSRRHKEDQTAGRRDEEEGLITIVATTAEDQGALGTHEHHALEDMRGLRLRGMVKIKTPPSIEELNEEENEETPMLSNMEETAVSQRHSEDGEMPNFVQMIATLPHRGFLQPVIDDEESISEHAKVSELHKDPELPQNADKAKPLELDSQVELTLSKPLMDLDIMRDAKDDIFLEATNDVDCAFSDVSTGGDMNFSSLGQLWRGSDGTFNKTPASHIEMCWINPDSQDNVNLGAQQWTLNNDTRSPDLTLNTRSPGGSGRSRRDTNPASTSLGNKGSMSGCLRPHDIPDLVLRNQADLHAMDDPLFLRRNNSSVDSGHSPEAVNTTPCSPGSSSQASVLEMTETDIDSADLPSQPESSQQTATHATHIEPAQSPNKV